MKIGIVKIAMILWFISNGIVFSQKNYSWETYPKMVENDMVPVSVTVEAFQKSGILVPRIIGSGFGIRKLNDFFIATNYHVIKDVGSNEKIEIGINTKNGKCYYYDVSIFKTDTLNDIAIIKINTQSIVALNKSIPDTVDEAQKFVPPGRFERTDSLKLGSLVFSVGYPLGLGSYFDVNKPCVRQGIISHIPNNSIIVIDGLTNHGNSGSPVFDLFSNKLIGMVVLFPSDYINVVDSKGVEHLFPYNSGLTFCVSAETILKLIP